MSIIEILLILIVVILVGPTILGLIFWSLWLLLRNQKRRFRR